MARKAKGTNTAESSQIETPSPGDGADALSDPPKKKSRNKKKGAGKVIKGLSYKKKPKKGGKVVKIPIHKSLIPSVREREKKEAKKIGRPSIYDEASFPGIGKRLAALGMSDKEISNIFGVNVSTLTLWKRRFPSFYTSLLEGKETQNKIVEMSLYERATGAETQEEIWEPKVDPVTKKRGEMELIRIIKKRLAPDPISMSLWLRVRNPERWPSESKLIDRSAKLEYKVIPDNVPQTELQDEIPGTEEMVDVSVTNRAVSMATDDTDEGDGE